MSISRVAQDVSFVALDDIIKGTLFLAGSNRVAVLKVPCNSRWWNDESLKGNYFHFFLLLYKNNCTRQVRRRVLLKSGCQFLNSDLKQQSSANTKQEDWNFSSWLGLQK